MKPKTQLQRDIVALSKRLKPITAKQQEWAFKHCTQHVAYRTAKHLVCSACGHTWNNQKTLAETLCGCTCPNCGTDLKVNDARKRTFKQISYVCVVTTCKGFQVVRILYVKAVSKKGMPVSYDCQEVVQRWITPDGKITTMALLRGMSFYVDLWMFGSQMEIRPHHRVYDMVSNCDAYPRMRVLPILKRNGFKGNFHQANPTTFLQSLLTDSKAETLLKAGQYGLLPHFIHYPQTMAKKWDAVKICIRNGYAIEDIALWCDYIDLLLNAGKDIKNAKYACPANLKAEHDQLVEQRNRRIERDRKEWERRREIERQENERRKVEQMQENERLYNEMKSKFFDLMFSDGVLCIQVLKSVQEFYEEGKAMRHCVFTNDYYLKPDSLVLSARIGDERIETIEVSLSTLSILQCRGIVNENTEHHDRIIKLVNKNINQICELASA